MLHTHVRLCHVAELEQLVRSMCSALSVCVKCLNTRCPTRPLPAELLVKSTHAGAIINRPAQKKRKDLPRVIEKLSIRSKHCYVYFFPVWVNLSTKCFVLLVRSAAGSIEVVLRPEWRVPAQSLENSQNDTDYS